MTTSPDASRGADDEWMERTVEVLLRDLAVAPDDDAWATYDLILVELAQRDPAVLARVALRDLDGDPPLREAGAHALGRAAEFAEPDLINQIGRTLLNVAESESERSVMNALAGAIGFVWNRSDDETFAVQRRHAAGENVTLRLAAAKHLALATPVPLPGHLIPTLRQLANDEDAEIRSWAEHGLSYEHGWPHEQDLD
jgi:hypothetical protein